MDQYLAAIYGTGSEEAIEKTAQGDMLAQLAQQAGLDLSQLSEEEIAALSAELFGPEGMAAQGQMPGGPPMPGQAPGGAPAPQGGAAGVNPALMAGAASQQGQDQVKMAHEQMMKEAEAKFAEADFLGRVMAHAYAQELKKIASVQQQPVTNFRKEASNQAFEKLAEMRASQILDAVGATDSGAQGAQVDGAQPQVDHQQAQAPQAPQAQQYQQPIAQPQLQEQQIAPEQGQQFEHVLNQRALEMLDQNGWDVEKILQVLQGGNNGVQG